MARNISSGLITNYTSSALNIALLVKLEYDDADALFWSGLTDITYDSQTYVGTGALGSVGNISENTLLAPSSLEVMLSGIPSSQISTALGDDYQGRAATVFMTTGEESSSGVLDGDYVHIIFKGLMDVMEIVEDGVTATVTLTLENELIRLTRKNERRMTDRDQRIRLAGDDGFSRVSVIQDTKLGWKDPLD